MKTFAGLKKGTKFKVVKNSNAHNYEIGVVYTMSRAGRTTTEPNIAKEFPVGNNLCASDCVLVASTLDELKKEMNDIIKDRESRLEDIRVKIAYLEETGKDKFDETEYKVYKTLKTLGSDATMAEKVEIITKLLR